ncbi:MAG: hypothetical protein AAFQ82_26095, partial [Myxococcota bacterium]
MRLTSTAPESSVASVAARLPELHGRLFKRGADSEFSMVEGVTALEMLQRRETVYAVTVTGREVVREKRRTSSTEKARMVLAQHRMDGETRRSGTEVKVTWTVQPITEPQQLEWITPGPAPGVATLPSDGEPVMVYSASSEHAKQVTVRQGGGGFSRVLSERDSTRE